MTATNDSHTSDDGQPDEVAASAYLDEITDRVYELKAMLRAVASSAKQAGDAEWALDVVRLAELGGRLADDIARDLDIQVAWPESESSAKAEPPSAIGLRSAWPFPRGTSGPH